MWINDGEFLATLTVWLGLMCVIGYYVVRIALMVREQRIMEHAFRLRLATLRGKAVREMAKPSES
jgi:hypothetical protein